MTSKPDSVSRKLLRHVFLWRLLRRFVSKKKIVLFFAHHDGEGNPKEMDGIALLFGHGKNTAGVFVYVVFVICGGWLQTVQCNPSQNHDVFHIPRSIFFVYWEGITTKR